MTINLSAPMLNKQQNVSFKAKEKPQQRSDETESQNTESKQMNRRAFLNTAAKLLALGATPAIIAQACTKIDIETNVTVDFDKLIDVVMGLAGTNTEILAELRELRKDMNANNEVTQQQLGVIISILNNQVGLDEATLNQVNNIYAALLNGSISFGDALKDILAVLNSIDQTTKAIYDELGKISGKLDVFMEQYGDNQETLFIMLNQIIKNQDYTNEVLVNIGDKEDKYFNQVINELNNVNNTLVNIEKKEGNSDKTLKQILVEMEKNNAQNAENFKKILEKLCLLDSHMQSKLNVVIQAIKDNKIDLTEAHNLLNQILVTVQSIDKNQSQTDLSSINDFLAQILESIKDIQGCDCKTEIFIDINIILNEIKDNGGKCGDKTKDKIDKCKKKINDHCNSHNKNKKYAQNNSVNNSYYANTNKYNEYAARKKRYNV